MRVREGARERKKCERRRKSKRLREKVRESVCVCERERLDNKNMRVMERLIHIKK